MRTSKALFCIYLHQNREQPNIESHIYRNSYRGIRPDRTLTQSTFPEGVEKYMKQLKTWLLF